MSPSADAPTRRELAMTVAAMVLVVAGAQLALAL